MKWLPVDGYEGWYEVSDAGDIRRVRNAPGARVGRILKPGKANRDYRYVILSKNGETRPQRVHLVVAKAFHGPRPPEHEANHRDGDKGNNAASNIEWVTKKRNLEHSYEIGIRNPNIVRLHGERNGAAKIDAATVRAIRAEKGAPLRDVAERYGVSRSLICMIQNGKRWAHL